MKNWMFIKLQETSEGKVREPCRGWFLKADGGTGVPGCRMVGEKCGLERRVENPNGYWREKAAEKIAFINR